MKQKIYLLSIIFFLAFAVTAVAQESSKPDVEIYGILYNQPHGLEGSPFLINNWCIGTIKLYHGRSAKNVKLKYSILDNELIYYNERFKRLFTVDRNTISSFTLKSGSADSLYFEKYDGPELGYRIRKNDLVQVIYNGDIKFLCKHTAEISEANDISSKDKIFSKDFYFVIANNNIDEIKLKLKSIIKLFPDHKQEIKKLAAQNHFRKKSELSFSKLIEQIEAKNLYK